MASLELDGQTERFRLRFRYDGRSYKRSLKTTNQREAIAAQARFEETLRLVETGRLQVPTDANPIDFLLSDGKVKSRPKVKTITIGKLLSTYIAELPEGAKEESTLYTETIHLKHLKRLINTRLSAADFTLTNLQNYVNKRLKERYRGRRTGSDTVKKEIATLRVAWNWALDRELVERAFPSRGLTFPKRSEKLAFMTWDEIVRTISRGGLDSTEEAEHWESLYLTRSEIDDLLVFLEEASIPPFIFPMILMTAHTGARRSEIVRSRLDDFDFHTGLVRLREKKRSRKRSITFRYVPMTQRLNESMKRWQQTRSGGQETFVLDSGKALSIRTASYWFERVLAGSRWEKIRGFHVLRHSFASNLAAGGVDQRIIDEWMGHQTDEMRRRYRHLFPDQQRKALESVFGARA